MFVTPLQVKTVNVILCWSTWIMTELLLFCDYLCSLGNGYNFIYMETACNCSDFKTQKRSIRSIKLQTN